GQRPLDPSRCQALKDRGQRPVAMSRGYGGLLAGPYWVDAERDVAREVGDEPLLLARTAPTQIARNRAAGARAVEIGPHPATLIVMDDGLQNPSLAKDFSLAVVDGARGLGNALAIPAGPLRPPLEFHLERTDAIIVNEPAGAPSGVTDWLRRRFAGPVLRARLAAERADWLKGARLIAWAGIGAP